MAQLLAVLGNHFFYYSPPQPAFAARIQFEGVHPHQDSWHVAYHGTTFGRVR
jgi:hypothetical protein